MKATSVSAGWLYSSAWTAPRGRATVSGPSGHGSSMASPPPDPTEAERPKLSDGGHEARRWQPRRPAAVRCSAWLGRELMTLSLSISRTGSPPSRYRKAQGSVKNRHDRHGDDVQCERVVFDVLW